MTNDNTFEGNWHELEARMSTGQLDQETTLELALYRLGFNRLDPALELLLSILETNPEWIEAQLWYAYLVCEFGYTVLPMPHVDDIITRLKNSGGDDGAIGHMLEYRRYLSLEFKDPPTLTLVECLEQSILCQPTWTLNRYYLAGLYGDLGRRDEAIIQLREAERNLIDKVGVWSLRTTLFEQWITGRFRDAMEGLVRERLRELSQR